MSVHPRSRGEHQRTDWRWLRSTGSSPLARGTHMNKNSRRQAKRFIPARAGNTRPSAHCGKSLAVHPRSRGEHILGQRGYCGASGSSPLARGTRNIDDQHQHQLRFIPARAGNTAAEVPLEQPATVHPRSRGEHEPRLPLVPLDSGSSPLARGTPRLGWRLGDAVRFIPARAGNTALSRLRRAD